MESQQPKLSQPQDDQEGTFGNLECLRRIGDKEVLINKAKVIDDNRLEIIIDDIPYQYTITKRMEYKTYFQCINRKKGVRTGKKCLAKAHHNSKTNNIEVIDLHNPRCEGIQLQLQDDYHSQKEDLIDILENNNNLTVIKGMTILREKNNNASNETKRFPMNYEQVKHIIKSFRQENQVDSNFSFDDPTFQKTKDGALFLRCNNKYNILYKNKIVANEYIIFCSPFQQNLLSKALHWHIDATFYIVPKNFYQLLVVLIYDDLVNLYMPACFVLISSKNVKMYESVFKDIRDFILDRRFDLERITLDFEKAEKEGAQRVFSDVEFLGCKFHLVQALLRKAKKKGLMSDNLEKESLEILANINEVLISGKRNLEDFLEELRVKYDSTSLDKETQATNNKFLSFILYIKNTWIQRYKEGMLSYSTKDKAEWTNNALERYHQRLQQQLTKNPSIQKFITEIQEEEKYFRDKYFQSFTYGSSFDRETRNLKRKEKPGQSSTSTKSLFTLENEVNFEPRYKMNKNDHNKTNEPSIKILLERPNPVLINAIAWSKWKNQSCRVDVFSTVSYHVFFYEFKDAIFPSISGPKLQGELHPFAILLQDINNAFTTPMLQKAIDNYINYRSKSKGEKPGKGAPISTLFYELNGLPQFTWKFKIAFNCDVCGSNNIRELTSEPLIVIPTSSLLMNSGICSLAIQNSLDNHSIICPKKCKELIAEKSVDFCPSYYSCVLDYGEDLAQGIIDSDSIPNIFIDEEFKFKNLSFSLVSIVYFQGMHYTTHVKGIWHPKFQPDRCPKWYYHDGIKDSMHLGKITKGLLFENDPVLNINLKKDAVKPYILIYKVIQC